MIANLYIMQTEWCIVLCGILQCYCNSTFESKQMANKIDIIYQMEMEKTVKSIESTQK